MGKLGQARISEEAARLSLEEEALRRRGNNRDRTGELAGEKGGLGEVF